MLFWQSTTDKERHGGHWVRVCWVKPCFNPVLCWLSISRVYSFHWRVIYFNDVSRQLNVLTLSAIFVMDVKLIKTFTLQHELSFFDVFIWQSLSAHLPFNSYTGDVPAVTGGPETPTATSNLLSPNTIHSSHCTYMISSHFPVLPICSLSPNNDSSLPLILALGPGEHF